MHPALPDLGQVDADFFQARKLDGQMPAATLATARCTEAQARRITALWAGLRDATYAAACHYPGYAVDLIRGGEAVLSAAICWRCHNIFLSGPMAKEELVTFDAESPDARALLALCQEVTGAA